MKLTKSNKRLFLVISGVCLSAVYLANASWLADPVGDVTVLAHRGVHQTYAREALTRDTCTAERIFPVTHTFIENTIPSMRAAFQHGADIVEIDIHSTADGHFAVFHDWTTDCRTNGKGITREQTLGDLQSLDIGYGYTADGGKTYPLRDLGVGLMPSLSEVLDTFPNKRFLINFKSDDPNEGEQFVELLMQREEQVTGRIAVYGGAGPTQRALELFPALRGFTRQSIKACLLRYALLGWSGYVPASCVDTIILIPINYASFLWGWPNRFLARMHAVGTEVYAAGPMSEARHGTAGIDDTEMFRNLGDEYRGGIWTNRVEIIGPLAHHDNQQM